MTSRFASQAIGKMMAQLGRSGATRPRAFCALKGKGV